MEENYSIAPRWLRAGDSVAKYNSAKYDRDILIAARGELEQGYSAVAQNRALKRQEYQNKMAETATNLQTEIDGLKPEVQRLQEAGTEREKLKPQLTALEDEVFKLTGKKPEPLYLEDEKGNKIPGRDGKCVTVDQALAVQRQQIEEKEATLANLKQVRKDWTLDARPGSTAERDRHPDLKAAILAVEKEVLVLKKQEGELKAWVDQKKTVQVAQELAKYQQESQRIAKEAGSPDPANDPAFMAAAQKFQVAVQAHPDDPAHPENSLHPERQAALLEVLNAERTFYKQARQQAQEKAGAEKAAAEKPALERAGAEKAVSGNAPPLPEGTAPPTPVKEAAAGNLPDAVLLPTASRSVSDLSAQERERLDAMLKGVALTRSIGPAVAASTVEAPNVPGMGGGRSLV